MNLHTPVSGVISIGESGRIDWTTKWKIAYLFQLLSQVESYIVMRIVPSASCRFVGSNTIIHCVLSKRNKQKRDLWIIGIEQHGCLIAFIFGKDTNVTDISGIVIKHWDVDCISFACSVQRPHLRRTWIIMSTSTFPCDDVEALICHSVWTSSRAWGTSSTHYSIRLWRLTWLALSIFENIYTAQSFVRALFIRELRCQYTSVLVLLPIPRHQNEAVSARTQTLP